jgi:hypothetical protein
LLLHGRIPKVGISNLAESFELFEHDASDLRETIAAAPSTSLHTVDRTRQGAILDLVRKRVSPRAGLQQYVKSCPVAHDTNTRTSSRGVAPLGRLSRGWAVFGACCSCLALSIRLRVRYNGV